MFGNLSEQFQKSTAPVSSLMALNAKALKALSEHQTSLFNGLVNDSVHYVNTIKSAKDANHVMAAQKECAEAVRERLAHVTQQTYHTLDAYRTDATDILRSTLEAPVATAETKPVAPVKVAATKAKPATKKAAPKKAASKPATKATATVTKSPSAAAKKTTSQAKPAAKPDAVKPTDVAAAQTVPTTVAPEAKTASAPTKSAQATSAAKTNTKTS